MGRKSLYKQGKIGDKIVTFVTKNIIPKKRIKEILPSVNHIRTYYRIQVYLDDEGWWMDNTRGNCQRRKWLKNKLDKIQRKIMEG